MSLEQLEHRIKLELPYIAFPMRTWLRPPEPEGAFDVVIVGAGQSGLAVAHGLLRQKVDNIVVLDQAAPGSEGVWTNFARMHTLRTHKKASGLDFGNPSLTPQAWYSAQFGAEAWDRIDKVPKDVWHAYLQWYRRVLDLPVRNGAEVTRVRPEGAVLSVGLADGQMLLARKVVLATGLAGSGRWHVPSLAAGLPKECYSHTEEAIDFAALNGARIGVLGGGASAFDNAATALEQGAASVELCIRLPALPRVNPNKWMESHGFLGHFHRLSDGDRWAFMRQIAAMNQPPPQETLWRCTRHSQFRLRTGTAWTAARWDNGAVTVSTPQAELRFDHLIFGTGTVTDVAQRPELSGFADAIATWGDRFDPPAQDRDEALSRSPYLGAGFQFTEKERGRAPFLRNIHAFNFGATMSQGLSASSISGMKFGVGRLIDGIVGDLFADDVQWQMRALHAYCEPEIRGYRPDLSIDDWEAGRPA